jgi:hypothetical protein
MSFTELAEYFGKGNVKSALIQRNILSAIMNTAAREFAGVFFV